MYLNNLIVKLQGKVPGWESTFIESLLNSKNEINSNEVLFASIIGVALAIILVIIINNKIYYRLFNYLKITRKHGEDDVWDFLFSSNEIEWINIRDKESNLVYQGAIRGYSEKDNKRELYLQNVIVYNDESEELYGSEHMYISFDLNSTIVIDFYKRGEESVTKD